MPLQLYRAASESSSGVRRLIALRHQVDRMTHCQLYLGPMCAEAHSCTVDRCCLWCWSSILRVFGAHGVKAFTPRRDYTSSEKLALLRAGSVSLNGSSPM